MVYFTALLRMALFTVCVSITFPAGWAIAKTLQHTHIKNKSIFFIKQNIE
jgi:hypothetical protein